MTGILTKCKAVRDKVPPVPSGLVMSSWCCKHAFSVESECTLAYCTSCKERITSRGKKEGGIRRGRSRTSNDLRDGRVGTEVVCCAKGECMKHTQADWDDLVDQYIENNCLKKTRQDNKELGWENVAENCWGCGKMF